MSEKKQSGQTDRKGTGKVIRRDSGASKIEIHREHHPGQTKLSNTHEPPPPKKK